MPLGGSEGLRKTYVVSACFCSLGTVFDCCRQWLFQSLFSDQFQRRTEAQKPRAASRSEINIEQDSQSPYAKGACMRLNHYAILRQITRECLSTNKIAYATIEEFLVIL